MKGDQVLAARRAPGKHLAGYWEFPGGKIEANETPEACLERELAEEFSIGSKVGPYIGENLHDYGEKVVRLLAYQVEHTSGSFQLVDHDEVRWLSIDQLYEVQWAPADIPLVEQYEARARATGYYASHATAYCEESSGFDVSGLYERFLAHLTPGGHILDLGCGSGRDSKAFREMGFGVTAVDSSPEMAQWASDFTGHPVAVKSFHDLDDQAAFDGVWASASLLHCHQDQLPDVIHRIVTSLKENGVAFLSFKWGEAATVDDRGRYFTNQTIQSLRRLLGHIAKTEILEIWESEMILRGQPQRWVYGVIRKVVEQNCK